ncbi:MAG: PSD1 and planctomycete cytochrome C domain-containing protein [Mariniblastus sp.]
MNENFRISFLDTTKQVFVSTVIVTSMACCLPSCLNAQEANLEFNRDVRPILASNCFACHGPDEEHRESDLRLDVRESATDAGAIVPGNAGQSELVSRIFSDDDDLQMPPTHLNKPLGEKDKSILKQWITEGARYDKHWGFVAPVKAPLPDVAMPNPIDKFVVDRLRQNKMKLSTTADRYTLIRRVYLDLTGLPPTPTEADAFALSSDSFAYQKIVDKLLASPRYGERWARPWLDLARYADTNGYEKDRQRNIWPYRDWVIRALNEDLPYDKFSIYQLAGDMLPNPTSDQMIATGFHRNTMLNEEGGIDPLEYRFQAMVDRVATTGTVWLGMTTGCAQCHTHKFDPITHTDYYRLMALMNNTDEPDFLIPEPDYESKRNAIESQIEKLESELFDKFAKQDKDFEHSVSEWISSIRPKVARWEIARPSAMKTNSPKLSIMKDGSIFSSGDVTKRDVFGFEFDLSKIEKPITAIRLEAIPDSRLPAGGQGRAYYEGPKGDFFLSEIAASIDGVAAEFSGASDGMHVTGSNDKKNRVLDQIGSSGWQPKNKKQERLQLVVNFAKPIDIAKAKKLNITLLFERHYAASLGRFRFAFTDKPDAVANSIPESVEELFANKPEADWTKADRAIVRKQFLLSTPVLHEARKPIAELRKRLPRLQATMVMRELDAVNARNTFRHHRGEYLSPKEKVTPGILEIFAASTPKDRLPKNRLEFARWLFSDSNPLAARVAVNRAWREFFGAGLLRTSGDFGVQSESPTHPELLDWLAVDFEENGWSLKKLHRLIVLSETYQQASAGNEELNRMDPGNRLLARGPRLRMSGEMIRDSILKSSGLLSTKMYGPGVRPPQPSSVTVLAYGNRKWNADKGENRFRRSVYTFRKRAAPFAAYTVFDAPTGETCVAKRNRSNTPLQALTVLNDEMFLEMAQAIAKSTVEKNFDSAEAKIKFIFRQFLIRAPTDDELASLQGFFSEQEKRLASADDVVEKGQNDKAKIAKGQNSIVEKLDPSKIAGSENATAELAALTMLARVVMNLDEALTKR